MLEGLEGVFEREARLPRRVVSQTAMAIPIVQFDDSHAVRQYLEAYTLPFIDLATAGADFLEFSDAALGGPQLEKPETDNNSWEISRSSADLAVVIFSYMPRLSGENGMEYARHGSLAAPLTTSDLVSRLVELREEITQIAKRGPEHLTRRDRLPLKRTLGFFKTGRLLDRFDLFAIS